LANLNLNLVIFGVKLQFSMMKTYGVFPCCYLPPIEYFFHLIQHPEVSIDIHENFVKQTYRNRCSILSPNGTLKLIVPVLRKGKTSKIKEVKIAYHENWQKIHWKSIEAAYRSSPYFEFYEDDFKSLFLESKHTFLADLNFQLLDKIIDLLGINVGYTKSESYIAHDDNMLDFRPISPKQKPDLNFPEYIQVFGDKNGFTPNLSILDLLFNEGPNAKSYLLSSVKSN